MLTISFSCGDRLYFFPSLGNFLFLRDGIPILFLFWGKNAVCLTRFRLAVELFSSNLQKVALSTRLVFWLSPLSMLLIFSLDPRKCFSFGKFPSPFLPDTRRNHSRLQAVHLPAFNLSPRYVFCSGKIFPDEVLPSSSFSHLFAVSNRQPTLDHLLLFLTRRCSPSSVPFSSLRRQCSLPTHFSLTAVF